jgi:DNA-binding winged helix-turn-helix (wHTH) protein
MMAEISTDTIIEENNLSQNISILRRVLGEKRGELRFIATILGRGFKFVASVQVLTSKSQVSGLNESEFSKSESQIEPENRIQNRKIYAFVAAILLISIGAAGHYFLGQFK